MVSFCTIPVLLIEEPGRPETTRREGMNMFDTRKIAAVALAGTLALAVTACGGKKDDSGSTASDDTTTTTSVTEGVETGTEVATGTSSASTATGQVTAAGYNYDYTPGTVNIIMNADGTAPLIPDFSVMGVIMTGNQMEGASEADLLAKGYQLTGLVSDYRLNEWISFYLDDNTLSSIGLDIDTCIVAVPHREASEYATMPYEELIQTANDSGGFVIDVIPETVDASSGRNYVGNAYVNMDNGQVGLWDILFCKGGKPAQYVCVNMSPAI